MNDHMLMHFENITKEIHELKLENKALKEGLRLANSEITSLNQRGITQHKSNLFALKGLSLERQKVFSGEQQPKPKSLLRRPCPNLFDDDCNF